MAEQESWLPNLVGGVSIWKLAVDLNDPKFMDGRLLEPETEGSDSLPARVSWDLTGLVPLRDARRDHPAEVEQAIAAFFACLEKVREQLEDEDSGYDRYREAFTVPGLDVDDGGNYFYGPDSGKLYVINWGASPRSVKHEQAFLFGYDSFRDLYDQEGVEPAAAGVATSAAAGQGPPDAQVAAEAAAPTKDEPPEQKKQKKDDEKAEEDEGKERPWWFWLLVALGAIALVVILLLLLQQCDEQKNGPDGADAGTPAASDDAGQGGASSDAGEDAAAQNADGGGGGAAGAGGGGGASQGGAGGAGGSAAGGAGGSGDGSGGATPVPAPGVEPGSGGSCGGTVLVIKGGGSGSGSGAPPTPPKPGESHRAHFHPGAIAWRVERGYQHVDRVQTEGRTYHVYLKPGETFEKVRVQWQDRNGRWHDH